MKQLFEYLNHILFTDAISAESITLLFLLLFSECIFCPVLALFAKIMEIFKNKALYNHLARQFTQAGLVAALPILLTIFILCGLYSYIADWHNLIYSGVISFNLTSELALHLAAATFVSLLLLQGSSLFFWKKQRKHTTVQFLLLAATSLTALSTVFFALYAVFMPTESEFSAVVSILASLPGGYVTGILLSSFCLASAWAGCWLLIRRSSDDFGRDYYNFAVRCCAWAAFSLALACVISVITQTILMEQSFAANKTDISALILAVVVIQIVCCGLWFFTARSIAPLRHKAALLFCLPVYAVSLVILLLSVLVP
jgi:hypothetical protein